VLVKAAFAREVRGGLLRPFARHIVLPAAGVWFVTFLHTDATRHGGWPMVAVAGAVWLLFANTVSQAGMTLWHERWLLRENRIAPGLLVTSAAVVPLTLFALQMTLVQLAVLVRDEPHGAALDDVVLAGGVAFATGLGTGILVARFFTVRRQTASALPKLLAASFVLTPVLYRLAALKDAGKVWCTINPLCAAAELARRNIARDPSALPAHAGVIALCLSAAILLWGFTTTRLSPTVLGADRD
jgi:ABC-type polysaccharide/polyol phosphate export permease